MSKTTTLVALTLAFLAVVGLFVGLEDPPANVPDRTLPQSTSMPSTEDSLAADQSLEMVETKLDEPPRPANSLETMNLGSEVAQSREWQLAEDFIAPEQLEIASYEALLSLDQRHQAAVDDMNCDSGSCRIVLTTPSKRGMNSAASEMMAELNEAFAGNPLTQNVAAGLVSVSVAENGAGRIELVTMKRKNPED